MCRQKFVYVVIGLQIRRKKNYRFGAAVVQLQPETVGKKTNTHLAVKYFARRLRKNKKKILRLQLYTAAWRTTAKAGNVNHGIHEQRREEEEGEKV